MGAALAIAVSILLVAAAVPSKVIIVVVITTAVSSYIVVAALVVLSAASLMFLLGRLLKVGAIECRRCIAACIVDEVAQCLLHVVQLLLDLGEGGLYLALYLLV